MNKLLLIAASATVVASITVAYQKNDPLEEEFKGLLSGEIPTYVDGKYATTAKIIDGQAYLPLRKVASALDTEVKYSPVAGLQRIDIRKKRSLRPNPYVWTAEKMVAWATKFQDVAAEAKAAVSLFEVANWRPRSTGNSEAFQRTMFDIDRAKRMVKVIADEEGFMKRRIAELVAKPTQLEANYWALFCVKNLEQELVDLPAQLDRTQMLGAPSEEEQVRLLKLALKVQQLSFDIDGHWLNLLRAHEQN